MGSELISCRDAVRFWVAKLIEKLEGDGLPAEMGMFAVIARPIIQKLAKKADNLSEADAAELIDHIHAMSAKLEEQTGIDSPYH